MANNDIVRHCGVVRSTGSRVIVLWRQIDESDKEHCLVVYRDSLPEVYRQPVETLTMGKGQNGVDLWDIFDKQGRLEGHNMLTALHQNGYIRKQATADIDMHVGGHRKVCLRDLNSEIDDSLRRKQETDGFVKDYNPFDKQEVQYPEQDGIVSRLLQEAQELETRAKENRDRAYSLDPSKRPVTHSAPVSENASRVFYIEIEEGISQAKAIERLKKEFKERRAK